ncbi:hypothetical protein L249_5611, partial [Ophiocordyceps polyrhachis-furcata BCC 54312]
MNQISVLRACQVHVYRLLSLLAKLYCFLSENTCSSSSSPASSPPQLCDRSRSFPFVKVSSCILLQLGKIIAGTGRRKGRSSPYIRDTLPPSMDGKSKQSSKGNIRHAATTRKPEKQHKQETYRHTHTNPAVPAVEL